MADSRRVLFANRSYQDLADQILKKDTTFIRGEIERREFPDGEHYLRVMTDVEDKEVVMLGGTIDDRDTLEIYDLCCAIVKYGACRISLLIPFFGYSTMERQVKRGEVVMAKTRARLLSAIPLAAQGNRAFLFDLHSDGIPHYFEGPMRSVAVTCRPLIQDLCRELGGSDFVLGSTDAGRAKWVESLANDLEVPPAFVYKKRIDGHTTIVTGISAHVKDKKVVVYDDMIRTGGSLLQAARAYKEAGASEIFAVASHGVFPGASLDKIVSSGLISKVACLDTHPRARELGKNGKLIVRSSAQLMVQQL